MDGGNEDFLRFWGLHHLEVMLSLEDTTGWILTGEGGKLDTGLLHMVSLVGPTRLMVKELESVLVGPPGCTKPLGWSWTRASLWLVPRFYHSSQFVTRLRALELHESPWLNVMCCPPVGQNFVGPWFRLVQRFRLGFRLALSLAFWSRV